MAGAGECAVPNALNATDAPLPHLAAALRDSRVVKVLAIGSSSTVGVGASSSRATYPSRLEDELERTFRGLDVEIVNRGVSGELAAATARRLRTEAAMLQPNIVLWQVGTNDALMRIPVDEFRQTVQDTVRWLRAHDTDVVLVGLQFTRHLANDTHYLAIKDVLREIATAENVPLVRRFDAMQHLDRSQNRSNLLSSDEFHLNDLGYRCMAEHVARAITVSIFYRPRSAGPAAAR